MASIYARNEILQIKYKDADGAWKRKSTGLADTPKNRVMVRDELLPAMATAMVEKQKVVEKKLFETYAMEYLKTVEHHKTYWEYHSRVKKIVSYFKGRDIREISVSELRVWISTIEAGSKTVKVYMGTCRGVFEMAIEDEVMDKNPFVHIRHKSSDSEASEIEPFSQEEVNLLLDNASGDLKTFLAIGFYAGLRAGEILGLQVSDVEYGIISVRRSISKGRVSTPKTKSSVRRVPLFDMLTPYLNEQIEKSRKANSIWLFQKDGRHVYGVDSIRGKKPYGAWSKLLSSLELRYRTIKNTRHTFIVAMLKSGELSVLEIAQMVGHTNTKMIIEHYARYIDGEQLKISRSFNPFDRGHTHGHTRVHTDKASSN